MSFLSRVALLVWKEVRAEWHSRQVTTAMLLFSLLVAAVFSFAFDPTREEMQQVLPGVIWVGLLFAALLGLNRSFSAEKRNDSLQGLMLCPAGRSFIFYGKAAAHLFFTLLTEAVTLPVYLLLFDFQLQGSWWLLAAVLVLGTAGFVAVGAFLAALAANVRASELLLPVVLFPVAVPVVIAGVEGTRLALAGETGLRPWLSLLGFYTAVFAVLPALLFDYLLEAD